LAEIESELARTEARPDPLQEKKENLLRYYFDSTGFRYEDALEASARSSSQLEHYVVAVPDNDAEGFIGDVWAERLKAMKKGGLELTEAQEREVFDVLRAQWMAYRGFMRGTYRAALERAESEDEVAVAREAAQVKWAETWSGINRDVPARLKRYANGRALAAALLPFL
jgi:hypothetical protein